MHIGVARPEQFPDLRRLEEEADERFGALGMGPFDPHEPDAAAAGDVYADAACVLVAGDPPVGSACVSVVDGEAYLSQLSVAVSAGRSGVGTALVQAVCAWAIAGGFGAVTLTTYRHVPWNRPFYERLGFVEIEVLGPELDGIRRREAYLEHWGERVAMRRPIGR